MRREIGLISDTHGLLRPDVHTALAGVELILHAGDVGGDDILLELGLIAPVHAVVGNCDDPRSGSLTRELNLELDGVTIHMSHGHELGVPKPNLLLEHYTADVLIYGHTHRPLVERHGKRLVVNPGAAGPRRFDIKPSVARLTISDGASEVQIVALNV